MSSNRILIITNGHLCRNPRTFKEAATLADAGYEVTVLGVRNHLPSDPADAELLRGARFRHESVDTLRTGSGARLGPRLSLWLARRLVALVGLQTPRALGPFDRLLRRARALPADLTIVHNEVAHCVGVHLLDRGRRVAADIEDWHSEDLLPSDRVQRPLELIRTTERTLLHRAIYTTTTSHALADALHARYGGRPPQVITNSPALPPQPRRVDSRQPPIFFWFSQTTGPGRGLEPFLSAWSRTTCPSRVVLLGETRPQFAAELLTTVPSERRSAVEFLSLVSPKELPAMIARHDIGLALEDKSILNRDLTITNKILQYLGGGLAVVASETAGQREVIDHDPAAGIVVPLDNPVACASLLDELLTDRVQLAARQLAARRLAETIYCWEREQPRLLDLVATALTSRA
jgi:glycosyltransferase involved in cell wall biosynthesis